ncbi:MAG: cell wall-active antibiotics response protein [Acidimicrobiia bacterium]|nr:cell wall-active antibiotics response protein [Acidimicrobiia bacterium]
MKRKLKRWLMWVVVAQVAGWVIGQIIAKKMTKGDETSDEFQVATIMGGKKFESHAKDLRSGVVITSMGGIDLDLTDATIGAEGAELELRTTMGGIQVTVPEAWAVKVESELKAGEFQVDVAPPEALPDDAPQLRIHAVTRMGGGLVTTKA